jgi:hypothetical protein
MKYGSAGTGVAIKGGKYKKEAINKDMSSCGFEPQTTASRSSHKAVSRSEFCTQEDLLGMKVCAEI